MIHETGGDGIRLQVVQLQNPEGTVPDVITCKARLLPDVSLINDKQANINNAMIYRMDSCFYLQHGTKKIYASLVQPIANGVSGTYEYLIEFESVMQGADPDFIYQDKYLNHKKYSLKLN